MGDILYYVILIMGFVALIKGADVFVEGASNIAVCLKVPTLIIGLTIVAFGTSAPETAVSIAASVSGNNDIAVGNVVGSNIFNLLVVAGISALIAPLALDYSVKKRDVPFTILFSIMLILFSFYFFRIAGDNFSLTRIEGLFLLALTSGYTYVLIRSALKNRNSEKSVDSELTVDRFEKRFFIKNVVRLLFGVAIVVIGGKAVVYSASLLASHWGWSERVIGITVVALGTSLPELCTSCCAIAHGESDLALGNVLGSNILNIGIVIGCSSLISPISIDAGILPDMIIMLLSILLFGFYTIFFKQVGRIFGGLMVVSYVLYTVHLILI